MMTAGRKRRIQIGGRVAATRPAMQKAEMRRIVVSTPGCMTMFVVVVVSALRGLPDAPLQCVL